MKKLIYIFSILVLVSCSSDNIKITEINSNNINMITPLIFKIAEM